MLPAPRINDMLHRVTVAAVWESPHESGSQAVGITEFFNDPGRERLNWLQSILFSALAIVGFVLGAILLAAVSGLTQSS
jgi:hypothetical protein